MSLEVRQLGERLIACMSSERLFYRVSAQVCLKFRGHSEAFPAFLALERPFASMNALAAFQLTGVDKGLRARVASVRSVSGVDA